ncbi:MAG: methyltransferase [Armatimonadota bacterium]|nr:methyltransferase [Armatimonadota bacterium]
MIPTALAAIGWMLLALGRAEAAVRFGDPLFLLAAAPAALSAFRLVFRREALREAPPLQRGVAWAGAVLPLFLRGQQPSSPIAWGAAAGGLIFALWALVSLGDAFGIAPAYRGRIVVRGPYRLLRHPAYAGELLSLTAFAATHPTPANLVILNAIAAILAARAIWEERILMEDPDYARYAERVRWRMVPFIW